MTSEVLILGSQRDYCNVLKEFLEMRDVPVRVMTDFKAGMQNLFDEKPGLSIIEVTDREISPGLIQQIKESQDFFIPDLTNKVVNEEPAGKNRVLILEDTANINLIFEYLKNSLPDLKEKTENDISLEKGSLKNCFYPFLLIEIYRKGLSGKLSFINDRALNIYFKNGSPVYAEGGDMDTMIGRILLNTGRIDGRTHREILEKSQAENRKIGEVLIESKAITPHELSSYLKIQTEEKIIRGLCELNGTYSFEEDAELPKDAVEQEIKLPKLVNEAVKRYIYAEDIQEVNPKIKLSTKPDVIINNMELKPKELRMVQLLKNNTKVSDLLKETRLEKYEALKLLFILALFKAIDLPGVSLESIGRNSVERYLSENKITIETQKAEDQEPDNENLIELELEVYESEMVQANGHISEKSYSQQIEEQDDESGESPNDTPEMFSSSINSQDIEPEQANQTEELIIQTKSQMPENEPDTETGEEIAEFIAPTDITEDTNTDPETVMESEPQNISIDEEVLLDLETVVPLEQSLEQNIEDTTPEPSPFGNTEVHEIPDTAEDPLEFLSELNETEEQTFEELQLETVEFDQVSEPPAEEIIGQESESQVTTPQEITIDDSDLFSTFENNNADTQQTVSLELENEAAPEHTHESQDVSDEGDLEFSQRVEEFHSSLADKDYYSVLGVSEDADQGRIRDAYYKLVKDHHPDVYHNISDEIREKAKEIFTIINAAYETLSDTEKRQSYNSKEQISELKNQAQSIYEAELEFKQGITLLTQRNYSEAKLKIGQALEMNPEEPAYIGAYAWARFLDSEDKKAITEELIGDLTRAITANPEIAENYYYLGSIYKNQENIAKAEENYEKALRADPNLIEAKREVRLIKTRKREKVSAPKNAKKIEKRFWSGLFKR